MIEKLSSLCVRFMPTFVSPATSIRSGPPTACLSGSYGADVYRARGGSSQVRASTVNQVGSLLRRPAPVALDSAAPPFDAKGLYGAARKATGTSRNLSSP